MKAIIPVLDEKSKRPYYLQLYDYIKDAIVAGEVNFGEKLPSLRSLAKSLKLSITTINLAYSQLLVEGYIFSKPNSGYFVGNIAINDINTKNGIFMKASEIAAIRESREGREVGEIRTEFDLNFGATQVQEQQSFLPSQYDLSCFDFNKWKKCSNKILTEYPYLLLTESEPQGEYNLRHEISKYLYRARGVICSPSQIVIGAGTQQITSQLCLLLSKMQINHVTVEDPCYLPVKNIFRDRGFMLNSVSISASGIDIRKLKADMKSAVYVCPSNQFPTGAVMPIGKRYELLEWANRNDSIIIEDDYDSELRYFGKPIPALKGLDVNNNVVYLGSFSSTLFPAIKISYMVLPERLSEVFELLKNDYTQTCSKAEQLTLALFMELGYYQINIKKLRNLYSQKLQTVLNFINSNARGLITPVNTFSGINMILTVNSNKSTDVLCEEANEVGLSVVPISIYTDEFKSNTKALIFYYNQIPLELIDEMLKALVSKWFTV